MIRIVKLTFASEHAEHFIEIFEGVKDRIRAAEGCLSLKMMQDRSNPGIFITYSIWKVPEDLQQYRRSELFKEVWMNLRPLFEEEPQAWSLDKLADL